MQKQGLHHPGATMGGFGTRPVQRPTFLVACWLLALLAFAQLITVGAALRAGNLEPALSKAIKTPAPVAITGPISPRSLDEILATEGYSPMPDPGSTEKPAPSISIDASSTTLEIPMNEPASIASQQVIIADPLVERLLSESRALQMDGDMMRAMLKLDEAGRIDPTEAAVIYHKGLLFEEMSLYEKAADQYLQVQQMGIQTGVYFKLAAKKLTKGMDVAHAHRPVISIGPMKVRRAPGTMSAKQADVSINILARPDKPINPADVNVQLYFYDKLNGGEIKKALDSSHIEKRWDSRVDWQDAGNEETLNISYTIPEVHLADAHLFGQRTFFGFVVELLYKGEVIDQQASPRRLNSIHGNNISPEFETPWLSRDQNSLLPGKHDLDDGEEASLLQLPRR